MQSLECTETKWHFPIEIALKNATERRDDRMDRKLHFFVTVFAVSLLIFVLSYYGYYMYIWLLWGVSERLIMLLISDSLFLLFIPAAVGLLLRKKFSWWLTMILFTQLFVAKVIAIAANIFLIVSGTIAETMQWSHFLVESLFLALYLLILIIFGLKPIREVLSVRLSPREWVWRVLAGAMGLYVLHFAITMVTVYLLTPQSP